jgi:hypothetical protein
MPTAQRVFERFLNREAARKLASRFVRAMSYDEAKRTLGISPRDNPSPDEVTKRYRERIKETMRTSPGAAKTQEEFKDLNIAKDTLLGQFDRRRPDGSPNTPDAAPPSPRNGPRTPPGGGFNPEDEFRRKKEEPAPMPEGVPFAAALSGLGNVDWKILTTGYWGYDVVVETEEPRTTYFAYTAEFILVGRTDSHYVFAKMTKKTNARGSSTYEVKDKFARWEAFKTGFPIERDLLKLAPKVISALRERARGGRTKFSVIEGTLTEDRMNNFRGTLSLPDAVAGSGILADGANDSSLKGRKVQVELEPVHNKEKHKALRDSGSREWHHGYDWFVYVNGKKYELDEREVEGLQKTYILISVFSYDYDKGKKNLTRLRGTRMKMGPRAALEALAKALKSGPLKDKIQQVADSFPAEK